MSSGGTNLSYPKSYVDVPPDLLLAGSKASREGWLRVFDGTTRAFYLNISSGKITLERPAGFGDDNPAWIDGTELCINRGSCSRCQDVLPKCAPGPVVLSAERNEVALAFLLCRPCLNWLVGSALLELEGKPPLGYPAPMPTEPLSSHGRGDAEAAVNHKAKLHRQQLIKVYKDANLSGAGDLLSHSRLARGIPKCLYSRLSEQTLRADRFEEQRADSLKAKVAAVVAGEARRRSARAAKMKLRYISEFNADGAGDYLCWFSAEGRVDYYGKTSSGRAHGWGLAEYQDGSWCCSYFLHGQQHTLKGGRLSTIQYGSGVRFHLVLVPSTWPRMPRGFSYQRRDRKHGEGIKTFADGAEHHGRFRGGVRDGPGVSIDCRGHKTEGSFRDDVFAAADDGGIIAPVGTDITIESGRFDPPTLLDLTLERLAVLAEREPALNRASRLTSKMPPHLLAMLARAYAAVAQGLSQGFRDVLPSLAWRNVRMVRLCNTKLTVLDTTKLVYFIEGMPDLERLVLVGCKLDGASVSPVSGAVAAAENLRELDLSWNPIRGEGIRGVIDAVKKAPRIRRLSVAGCQLGFEGGREMFSALGAGREVFRLEDLDLSFNSIGAGVGEILEQALRLNQTLTRLNLRANGLGPHGGAKLAAGIAGNCGRLTELLVTDNRLGVGVVATVAASMRGGTRACLSGFGRGPMDCSISGERYATTLDESEASSRRSNLDTALTEAGDAKGVTCDEGDIATDEGTGKQSTSSAVQYQ